MTQLESILRKELDTFLKVYKRKPSAEEFRNYIKRVDQKLFAELDSAIKSQLRVAYNKEKVLASKELGVRLPFNHLDRTAFAAMTNRRVLFNAITGMKNTTVRRLRDAFQETVMNPEGYNLRTLQQQIKEIANVSDFRAENIARTEISNISVASRRISYLQADPTDSYLYRHAGPNDSRTTDTSKRIKARVGNGVRWNEYVQIVREESAKDFPTWEVNPLAPKSHWNSRHFPLRVVGSGKTKL